MEAHSHMADSTWIKIGYRCTASSVVTRHRRRRQRWDCNSENKTHTHEEMQQKNRKEKRVKLAQYSQPSSLELSQNADQIHCRQSAITPHLHSSSIMNGSSCRSRPVNEVTMITDVKKMVQNAMKYPWNFIKYRKTRFMTTASDMTNRLRPTDTCNLTITA